MQCCILFPVAGRRGRQIPRIYYPDIFAISASTPLQVRGHWVSHCMETSLASNGPEDRAAARVGSQLSAHHRNVQTGRTHEQHDISAGSRDRTSWSRLHQPTGENTLACLFALPARQVSDVRRPNVCDCTRPCESAFCLRRITCMCRRFDLVA